MGLSFRLLGCGSSGGVPRIHGDWGDCDPENPKIVGLAVPCWYPVKGRAARPMC